MDNNNMTETTPKTQAIINSTAANYALNGKIMLSSVLILFFVIFSVVFFHTYSRCRRRRPRTHFDLHDSQPHLYLISGFRRRNSSVAETVLPGLRKNGLDPSLLVSLPTFLFPEVDHGPATASASAECAVCLSEFEAGDKIRALPKCRHAFHATCIDAWFRSHSNCPLCRSPVAQPDPDAEESAPPVPPPPPPSSASGDVRVEVPANDPGASEPRDDESGSSERCERKPRSGLAGLASRDDQTGLGEPDRNRVMVRCSLKRIWSI